MKKIISVLILLIMSNSVSASSSWMSDLSEAKKMAIVSNKLIFVDFTASWCGPCKKMERESWSNIEVKKMMSNYIPVQIDIDYNRLLAQKYGVRGIPNIFILDPNGKILYQDMSYKSKNEVLDLLDKYALNTAFLQNAYSFYYKKQTVATSFRLASKIQDYSLFLDRELRNKYLSLSNEYLKITLKKLKKSDNSNQKDITEKITLLKIQNDLFKRKTKKVLKAILKINKANLSEYSYAQFCFLNYAAFKFEKNEIKEKEWMSQLETTGKALLFENKLKLLFN